jgi:prefoldin alpha subunit
MTVLDPLTNSLHVPGHLSDAENVFIDVGTVYYVKKVCARSHVIVRC